MNSIQILKFIRRLAENHVQQHTDVQLWPLSKKNKLMKTSITIVLALFALSASASKTQKIEQSFEAFMGLFHHNLNMAPSDLGEAFFSSDFSYVNTRGDTLDAEAFLLHLESLGEQGSILGAMARGFVFTGTEATPTFASLHNNLQDILLIEVKPNALRLRKLPTTNSPVICVLRQGFYSGLRGQMQEEICDPISGLTWVSLQLEHEQLGLVNGYLATDYIRTLEVELPRTLVATLTDEGWKITAVL